MRLWSLLMRKASAMHSVNEKWNSVVPAARFPLCQAVLLLAPGAHDDSSASFEHDLSRAVACNLRRIVYNVTVEWSLLKLGISFTYIK